MKARFLLALQLWLCMLSFVGLSVMPRPAQAIDRDVRSVLVAGGYGIAAGTALGLMSLPATHSARAVFIGSSIGLYLGIAVGFYYILNRDDPQSPLHSNNPLIPSSQSAGSGGEIEKPTSSRDLLALNATTPSDKTSSNQPFTLGITVKKW